MKRKNVSSKGSFEHFVVLPNSLWDEEKIVARTSWNKYVVAILLVIFATLTKLYLITFIGDTAPFLLYFGAILISAGYGGVGPSVLALFLSLFLSDYFFIAPHHTLVVSRVAEIQLGIFFIEGLIIIAMSRALKREGQKNIEREKRFQSLIEKSNDLLILANQYGQIIYVSPSIKQILGYTKEEIIGQDFMQKIHPDDKNRVLATQNKIQSNFGNSFTVQYRISHKSGKWVWLEQTATNYIAEPGVQAIVMNIRDITDRKLSEEKLKASEAKFRRLFESDIIGTFISNFDGKFLEANNLLLNMLGYTREELRKGKLQRDKLTPKEYASISWQAVNDLQTTGSTKPYEKIYLHKNGTKIPVLIAVTRLDEKSDMCIGFVLNITEQKELEQRKDDFISMASHELKTPVTSLKVFTQLLQRQLQGDKNITRYLQRMDEQINRLHILISDLLDVTKIQAGKLELRKESISLQALISDTVEIMQATYAKHKIIIKGNMAGNINADYDRIHQVLMNLLTNAMKYSSGTKKIIIDVTLDTNTAIIQVTDFGLGIDEKHQKKIFERFYRVYDVHDKTYPGLGMGLYISSEIIKRHGGNMGVKSKIGKGSTFYFTLPLQKAIPVNQLSN